MNFFKKPLALLITVIMIFCIGGCTTKSSEPPENPATKTITVGTFASIKPLSDIVTNILAERYGYEVEVVIFEGNTMPATALMDGEVDMVLGNSLTWMKTFCKQNNCDFTMIEPYYFYTPLGLYSKKFESVDALPNGAEIAIPSDATNMQKSLLILQDAGLIKLGTPKDNFITILDIVENPKNVTFFEADITNSARSIDDVDAVISTGNVAIESGKIDPFSYIFIDQNPTPVGFFVHTKDINTEWAAQISKIIESNEINTTFNEAFQGRFFLVSEFEK
jgi:D-methionine transport system substrate-binding protein